MLRIKKIVATKVHGYIPINLSFRNDLTFVTGSNGCGKTTALKLISAILQPDFERLNRISFEELKLTIWISQRTFQINITKDLTGKENLIRWEITESIRSNKKSEDVKKRTGAFRLYQPRTVRFAPVEEVRALKESILSEFISSDFHHIIDALGNPILLGIDRKINSNIYARRSLAARRRASDSEDQGNASFRDAEFVVRDYVSNNAEKKKELVEEFKTNIFHTLFKYIHSEGDEVGYSIITDKSLSRIKKNTLSAIKRLDIGHTIQKEVNEYFSNISDLQNILFKKESTKDEDDVRTKKLNEWFTNRPHLKRIELVSEHAERYQAKIDELDQPLNKIIELTNYFFQESNKRILIGANGLIYVEWNDEELTTQNLSSGEIQLIVIIVHLVFSEYTKHHSVFIIDEPELSLHISWQEKFVDALLEASPNTQFILATHSPAIISKLEYERNCIYMKNV